MPIPALDLENMIKAVFPTSTITIKALVNDNDHFHVTIQSKDFNGKTRLQQHQMVYAALKGCVGDTLHALSLTTLPHSDS